MRRARTPPSLGFWPKLVAATAPRSLLLQGYGGESKGRRRMLARTPNSSESPTRKVPSAKQRKTLHQTRWRSLPENVVSHRASPRWAQPPPWGYGTDAGP